MTGSDLRLRHLAHSMNEPSCGGWPKYRATKVVGEKRHFAFCGKVGRRVASGDVFTLDVQRLTVNPALRVRFTPRGEAY